jgi:hypothetical protein
VSNLRIAISSDEAYAIGDALRVRLFPKGLRKLATYCGGGMPLAKTPCSNDFRPPEHEPHETIFHQPATPQAAPTRTATTSTHFATRHTAQLGDQCESMPVHRSMTNALTINN